MIENNKFFLKLEFKFGNNKKYKVETTQDSAVYTNKAKGKLPGLYFQKGYQEVENT